MAKPEVCGILDVSVELADGEDDGHELEDGCGGEDKAGSTLANSSSKVVVLTLLMSVAVVRSVDGDQLADLRNV